MTGWELRIWRKSMLWSREKAAREFGVTQRTWHAWENAEQVDVTVWRTTQALSVRIPLYSITDWHRSPISDSHPFDQPGT
ncbi:TPA: hypothetical protein ACH71Y_005207 [Escherichia coli]|uniref:helix-turn-helix transcriptional regulator n=1 Tax=Escherichia coli TaxID=562 RepID=UPI00268A3698